MRVRKDSLGVRLAKGFGSVLLLQIVIAALVYVQFSAISRDYARALEDRTRNIALAGRVSETMQARNSALRSLLITGSPEAEFALTNADKALTEAIKQVQPYVTAADEAVFTELLGYESDLAGKQNQMLMSWRMGSREQAIELLKQSEVVTAKAGVKAEAFRTMQSEAAHQEMVRLAAASQWTLLATLGLAAAALVLGIFFAIRTTRRVVEPIRQVQRAAEQLAAGDLTWVELDTKSRDEVGKMAAAVATAFGSLRETLGQVMAAASQVAAAAGELQVTSEQAAQSSQEISGAVTQIAVRAHNGMTGAQMVNQAMAELQQAVAQIASGAQNQAAGVQESATGMNQVMGQTETVSALVRNVTSASGRAADAVQQGSAVVGQTVAGMKAIQSAVGDATAQVKTLGDASRKIGEITAVITEIADQTNLLALNAAIEAARAGDAGRGFAVVADEVRKLAERSSRSAGEIGRLIADMQKSTNQVMKAMESGNEQALSGADLAESAGFALEQIREAVTVTHQEVEAIDASVTAVATSNRRMSEAMNEVAAVTEENTAATEEMAGGVEQVLGSVEEMAQGVSETAAAAEQVSAVVEEVTASNERIADAATALARVASELQVLVQRFKLPQAAQESGVASAMAELVEAEEPQETAADD